jgi:3-methyladenine DNA glycosylase Tag
MNPPPRIKPKGLADYLEAMSKPVFQAGMSWKVVDAKWPSIKEAFHDFDPGWVADLSPKDIDRLAADPKVIRNRKKIEGIVANAGTMLELNTTHRSFRRYLRSFPDYEALARDLRHQFHFLGDHGVYSFLWTVSEEVPDYEEWAAAHGRPNPSIGPPGDNA